jgi:hypothetical protein
MVSILGPLSNLQGPLLEPVKARDVGFGRIGIMGVWWGVIGI